MGLEEYFTKAIELYKKSEKKTVNLIKEMKDILLKYKVAKDYGEINTLTQQRLDALFYDIRKEL